MCVFFCCSRTSCFYSLLSFFLHVVFQGYFECSWAFLFFSLYVPYFVCIELCSFLTAYIYIFLQSCNMSFVHISSLPLCYLCCPLFFCFLLFFQHFFLFFYHFHLCSFLQLYLSALFLPQSSIFINLMAICRVLLFSSRIMFCFFP